MHSIKRTSDVDGKMQEFKEQSENLAERLLEEKYATKEYEDVAMGIDEVYENPLTRRRAVNTIIKMDNQERYFESLSRVMNESTFTANFGATPEAIIRSIRVANPNSVIEDIADVQTITSMVGMVGYIKPVYSKSIRGATAGNLLVEGKTDNYAAGKLDENIATTTATDATYSANLTYTPIYPGKVTVVYNGYEIAKDDGRGNLVNLTGMSYLSEASGASNEIDYTTGHVGVEFATGTIETGKALVINYEYDSEQNTDAHGSVELIWVSDPVRAEMHPLNFRFSLTSMLLAQSANFSVEEVLNDAASQYLKTERDQRGIEYNNRLALANPTLTFDASASAGGDNNNKMRAQILELTIESAGDAMYEDKNRGGVSYIIAGSQAATYINLLDNFTKDNSSPQIGAYKIGNLGKAPVIKARTQDLGQDEIIVGYKNQWGEAPFILADYLDYATDALTTSDFQTQRGLCSYYTMVKVDSSFARKIKINNLPA